MLPCSASYLVVTLIRCDILKRSLIIVSLHWRRKMKDKKCEDCYYWMLLIHTFNGECRKNPPVANTLFPMTDRKDWCGSWSRDGKD